MATFSGTFILQLLEVFCAEVGLFYYTYRNNPITAQKTYNRTRSLWMSTVAKPQLRGLLTSQIKKNLIGMSILSIGAALLFKVFVADRRKQRYADFYKTYDAEKQLQIMNEAGLMQSYIAKKK